MKTVRCALIALALGLAAASVGAATAVADEDPAGSRFHPRAGWFFGANLGTGPIGYGDSSIEGGGGGFLDLRFGGMLTSRLALALEYWSDGHR
jgi:hypothetical protein